MAFVIDQFDGWVEYVPDVGDNRMSEHPMTVEIQPMSTGEFKAWQRQWGPRLQGKNGLGRAQVMTEKMVSQKCRGVKLCVARNHTTGEEFDITTGEDLAKHGPVSLLEDIFSAITDASVVAAGLKKNLESQSDSCSAETPPSGGTADPAKGKVVIKRASQGDKLSGGSETATAKQTPISRGDSLPS